MDRLAAEVTKMHPKARPSEVVASEIEPSPGEQAMTIYLKRAGGDETSLYPFLMAGDKGSGYMVGGLWRGGGPHTSQRSGRQIHPIENKSIHLKY